MGNYLNARMRGRGTGPTIASWFSPGKAPQEQFLVVAVNYVPNQSQCHVRLPLADRAGEKWRLQDELRPASFERNGDDLQGKGRFLDLAPWQASGFAL
jgi:hypothetical protein